MSATHALPVMSRAVASIVLAAAESVCVSACASPSNVRVVQRGEPDLERGIHRGGDRGQIALAQRLVPLLAGQLEGFVSLGADLIGGVESGTEFAEEPVAAGQLELPESGEPGIEIGPHGRRPALDLGHHLAIGRRRGLQAVVGGKALHEHLEQAGDEAVGPRVEGLRARGRLVASPGFGPLTGPMKRRRTDKPTMGARRAVLADRLQQPANLKIMTENALDQARDMLKIAAVAATLSRVPKSDERKITFKAKLLNYN